MGITASRTGSAPLSFETNPQRYRHWKLSYDGPVATLSMDVQEDAGLSPDYKLKLNSRMRFNACASNIPRCTAWS